ncbi:hypothetical protein LZ32DRAFT_24097 [Colletotrichum eremochloae]|nr:hypothetical protein LZ32DRAFT_24097 [Colletotrichum eremochloae]
MARPEVADEPRKHLSDTFSRPYSRPPPKTSCSLLRRVSCSRRFPIWSFSSRSRIAHRHDPTHPQLANRTSPSVVPPPWPVLGAFVRGGWRFARTRRRSRPPRRPSRRGYPCEKDRELNRNQAALLIVDYSHLAGSLHAVRHAALASSHVWARHIQTYGSGSSAAV